LIKILIGSTMQLQFVQSFASRGLLDADYTH